MIEREQELGSAHEVQRFHRDVTETKDWIEEKDDGKIASKYFEKNIVENNTKTVLQLQR